MFSNCKTPFIELEYSCAVFCRRVFLFSVAVTICSRRFNCKTPFIDESPEYQRSCMSPVNRSSECPAVLIVKLPFYQMPLYIICRVGSIAKLPFSIKRKGRKDPSVSPPLPRSYVKVIACISCTGPRRPRP